MSSASEPRNPLYLLLLLAGLVFVVTALAYAVVPVLEQKAADAGQPPPPSELRDALRRDGWRWLLWELAVMTVFGVASMVLDHLRDRRRPEGASSVATGGSPVARLGTGEPEVSQSTGLTSSMSAKKPSARVGWM